ncbi:MAG: hypothetical protein ACR2QO_24115 [Acidimicrobiales bacterium]
MSQFRCIIQAESNADQRRDRLERRLAEHHAKHYPDEKTTVRWMAIPSGHMFTDGQPSTSSIVSCFVDHDTTIDTRTTYMRDLCDLWTEITDCTDHEVVVTITETVNANTDQE